jgi:hypothetical protein
MVVANIVLTPNFSAHDNDKTTNYGWAVLAAVLGILTAFVTYIGLELILTEGHKTSHLAPLAWLAFPFYGVLWVLQYIVRKVFHYTAKGGEYVLSAPVAVTNTIGEGVEQLTPNYA